MIWKLLSNTLISLIFFISIEAASEPIAKPFEIDTVVVTFFWFDTLAELNAAFPEDDGRLSGWSDCEIYEDHNFAHCDFYVVRPQVVDGEHTLTIGHEVVHGVHGDYHEEVE